MARSRTVVHDTFSVPAFISPEVPGGSTDRVWTKVFLRFHWAEKLTKDVDKRVGVGDGSRELDKPRFLFRKEDVPSSNYKGLFIVLSEDEIYKIDVSKSDHDRDGLRRFVGEAFPKGMRASLGDYPVPTEADWV